MSLLVFVIVVIVILALLCAGVAKVPQLAPYNGLIQLLLILIAVLAIANRAGIV